MKLTAEGGTDGANIVLFWPEHLPSEPSHDPNAFDVDAVVALRKQGLLVWFPCEGDGGYSLNVFVDEDGPPELMQYSTEVEQIPQLTARGVAYFGGLEYLFKHDRSRLDKYPGMMEPVPIPDGTYSARVYETEVPESVYDAWLLEKAGPQAKKYWDRQGTVAACAGGGILAVLVGFFLMSWPTWFVAVLLASAMFYASIAMTNSASYQAVYRAREAYGLAYPSYVLELRRVTEGA